MEMSIIMKKIIDEIIPVASLSSVSVTDSEPLSLSTFSLTTFAIIASRCP